MFPAKIRHVMVESPRGYGAHEVSQLEPCDAYFEPCDAYFEPYQIHVCLYALQKTLQQYDIKLERVLQLRFLTMYSRVQSTGG